MQILIETALSADTERVVKHIMQLIRGVITREEFLIQMTMVVIDNVDINHMSEELMTSMKNALNKLEMLSFMVVS